MKNVRVKVTKYTCYGGYSIGIYEGKKLLMRKSGSNWEWKTVEGAIRNAKAMANRIGIKYDTEIVKLHGC